MIWQHSRICESRGSCYPAVSSGRVVSSGGWRVVSSGGSCRSLEWLWEWSLYWLLKSSERRCSRRTPLGWYPQRGGARRASPVEWQIRVGNVWVDVGSGWGPRLLTRCGLEGEARGFWPDVGSGRGLRFSFWSHIRLVSELGPLAGKWSLQVFGHVSWSRRRSKSDHYNNACFIHSPVPKDSQSVMMFIFASKRVTSHWMEI